MTDAAAALRPSRPHARPRALAWRPDLARRIVAAHLLTAALALAAALVVGGADLALLRAAAAAALAGAAALWIGACLGRQIGAPVAAMLRALEAGAEMPAAEDDLARLAGGMRRLLATVADRTAASETFAADIAHEIRNPLASLRAAAEALARAEPEQRARLVDVIADDVARLDRLVGEIAGVSRLDNELVHEQADPFDLAATSRALVAHFSTAAADRGVELSADLPLGPLPVLGLEARLAQVLVNLIENAVSLCEPGDAVRVRLRRQDRRVLLVVEDTGPGIPDGEAEKIFRRFYSHRPAAQAGAHSGLGLAISRQIVEAHGGMIWAETIRPTASDPLSEPLGARFVVVLPQ